MTGIHPRMPLILYKKDIFNGKGLCRLLFWLGCALSEAKGMNIEMKDINRNLDNYVYTM